MRMIFLNDSVITKIFAGLLLVVITIIGLTVILSKATHPIPQDPPPARTPTQEFTAIHNDADVLTRLSLLPTTSLYAPLIAIVIENHENARPFQKGLDRAVLISEFLVEGFISRFVALFSVTNLPEIVGPVRSLRPYFIDAVQPWTSLFLYAGGSPDALEKIEQVNTPHINGLFLPEHFMRMTSIAEPHNLFLSKNATLDLIQTTSLVNRDSMAFSRGPIPSNQHAQAVRVNFFNPDHNVTFTYDPMTASYTRLNGTIQTNAAPQNILILEAPIKTIGSYGRLDIPMEGTGSLLMFQSGKMSKGVWQKNTFQPFVFTDNNNQLLPFNSGQIWMMVLETLERVKWVPPP